MQLYFRIAYNSLSTQVLEVEATDSILYLKQRIYDKRGIPVSYQRFIFKGIELENNKTLLDYNIQKESTILVAGSLSSILPHFTYTNAKDKLNSLLLLSDQDRSEAIIPFKEFKTRERDSTFIFSKYPEILSTLQATYLGKFLKFYYTKNRKEGEFDMRLLIKDEDFLCLLQPLDVHSKIKSKVVKERLAAAYDKVSRVLSRRIGMRITLGPTEGCIKFNTSCFSVIKVALNSSVEYEGGKDCFFVFGNLDIIEKVPIGSLLGYSSNQLHGVTKLTKGVKMSLFMVFDVMNESEKDVHYVQRSDINQYLELNA